MTGLDDMPRGILLWRGILQWLGGIGIIVVAMVFLPELRVGGMQIFRAESFDTFGKILPRATQIASQISAIYVSVTVACIVTYLLLGMSPFDAIVHAFTTVSTGGMANYDASFGVFSGPIEYAASVFMILSALPFVRYVQMLNGNYNAPLMDVQVRGFLYTVVVLVIMTSFLLTKIFPPPLGASLSRGAFQYYVNYIGHWLCQCRLYDLGSVSHYRLLFHRLDWGLRWVYGMLDKDI